MAGYSGTPLIKKLGIKEGFSILAINSPKNYSELLGPLPKNSSLSREGTNIDFIHLFVTSRSELRKELPQLKKRLKQEGALWISWYKKSAGIPTDITEDVIRDEALPLGLVDVKVCAVDEKWSGLKLVIRKGNRK